MRRWRAVGVRRRARVGDREEHDLAPVLAEDADVAVDLALHLIVERALAEMDDLAVDLPVELVAISELDDHGTCTQLVGVARPLVERGRTSSRLRLPLA